MVNSVSRVHLCINGWAVQRPVQHCPPSIAVRNTVLHVSELAMGLPSAFEKFAEIRLELW